MFLVADSGTGTAKLYLLMHLTNMYDLSNPCIHITYVPSGWSHFRSHHPMLKGMPFVVINLPYVCIQCCSHTPHHPI